MLYAPRLPLLLAALALSGCARLLTDDPLPGPATAPTATTGGLRGTISPAGAVRTVRVVPATGPALSEEPAASGAFYFTRLQPGTYNVSFETTPGFATPAARSATVVAGADTDLGTISSSFGSGQLRGMVSWEADGTSYVATSVGGDLDDFTATATAGNRAETLTLRLPFVNKPGVYRLEGGLSLTKALYVTTVNGLPVGSYDTTIGPGLKGTVNVTAYDFFAGTSSGTFGFVAADPAAPSRTITITNGRYSLQE